MFVIPVNPNSIYIPIIKTGCMKKEFDSTYPIHLNGIINQLQFRISIDRINRTISGNGCSITLFIIFMISIMGGLICFDLGGKIADNSGISGLPILVDVGIGIIFFGFIIICIGYCRVSSKRIGRMRKVINEESMKYSSRSPTPCSWRLDTTRHCANAHGNHYYNRVVYHLVIDIGHAKVPESGTHDSNQAASGSTVLVGRQDDSVPPPYPNQTAGFCSQCGAPRQEITAKFCSSCGHSFNKS